MSTVSSALWVAYGPEGNVVGTIRRDDEGYTATVAGADASVGKALCVPGGYVQASRLLKPSLSEEHP